MKPKDWRSISRPHEWLDTRCHVTGKFCLINKTAAKNSAKRMKSRYPERALMDSYRCQFCGWWHIGHSSLQPRAKSPQGVCQS